jgi:SusD family
MPHILRSAVGASVLGLGLVACNLDVTNPSVIDASKFNPAADGQTLALSAQTNFYIAFQSLAFYGGLISDEIWTGAIRLQTNNIASRNFVGTDDINADFFSPLSLAAVSNISAASVLQTGSAASTDLNLAMAQMNAAYTFEIMAETMCTSVINGGPALTDAQLLDSAITRFTAAVTIATAAGPSGSAIQAQSTIGLARAYLQAGQYTNAATTAAQVAGGFTAYVVTTANSSTLDTLANQFYLNQQLGQLVVPKRYWHLNDPRVQVDSTTCVISDPTLPCVLQLKYTSFAAPIRLASSLEASFIAAEAQLHGSGSTGPALSLIASERATNGQPPYSGGTDTLSVVEQLLNQRAREFWMEGKKLGDLRRNPSVVLDSVLTDPNGAPFYGAGSATFGSNFCTPIPPEEIAANPNLSGSTSGSLRRARSSSPMR